MKNRPETRAALGNRGSLCLLWFPCDYKVGFMVVRVRNHEAGAATPFILNPHSSGINIHPTLCLGERSSENPRRAWESGDFTVCKVSLRVLGLLCKRAGGTPRGGRRRSLYTLPPILAG